MKVARRLLAIVLLSLSAAWSAEIRGKVVNARGGEPLGRVRVSLVDTEFSTVTAPDGSFSLPNLSPGTYTLRIDAVGFWLQKVAVQISSASEVKDYSIALSSEGLGRSDTVEVRGDIFRRVETAGVDQMSVTSEELKSTATLIASDPFRTVQVLPGVSAPSNNDAYSEFNVLGAPFSTIGIYIDDVQLRNPVHGIPGFSDSASISVFSTDTIESLTLTPTAFSERYADSTGAALDIRTREGSRTPPQFRVTVGMVEAHALAEGSLGNKRGSWLVAARRSYMGYLIRATGMANVPAVGFSDADAKVTYDLTNKQTLDLFAIDGNTYLDRTHEENAVLGPNSLTFGDHTMTLARVGWRYAIAPRLLVSSRVAYIREKLLTRNPSRQPLDRTYYGEWVGGATAAWSWKNDQIFELGYDARRLRDGAGYFNYAEPGWDESDYSAARNATGFRHGAYVQQSSALFDKRLHLMGGLRWDHLAYVGAQPVSPQASASFRVLGGTEVQFGFGRYVQFTDLIALGPRQSDLPALPDLYSFAVLYDRSTHYLAAVEQRLGEHSRLRLEAFEHYDSYQYGRRPLGASGPFQPADRSKLVLPYSTQYSRGFQAVLQRRSSNGLAGWIGYTLDYVRQTTHRGAAPPPGSPPLIIPDFIYGTFPTMLDQRHTLNAFGSYRLKPTVSLSTKWMYGSGYPMASYLRKVGSDYFSSDSPTFIYMPHYLRLDLRMDKNFDLKRRKLTLSVEILNATNHHNMRFLGYDNFDPVTGRVFLRLDRALPIAPTAGLSFEF